MKNHNNPSTMDSDKLGILTGENGAEQMSDSLYAELDLLLDSSLFDPSPLPPARPQGNDKPPSVQAHDPDRHRRIRHSTPVSDRGGAAILDVDRDISALSPIRGPKKQYVEKSTSTREHRTKLAASARKGDEIKSASDKEPKASKSVSIKKRESEKQASTKTRGSEKSSSDAKQIVGNSSSRRKGGIGTPKELSSRSSKPVVVPSTRNGHADILHSTRECDTGIMGTARHRKTKRSDVSGNPKSSTERRHEEPPSIRNLGEINGSINDRNKQQGQGRNEKALIKKVDRTTIDIPKSKRDLFGLPDDNADTCKWETFGDEIHTRGTDDLVKMYKQVCDNKNRILENERQLTNQDVDMERLMMLSDDLGTNVSKTTRHLEEVKKVSQFLKAEEQKHRVAVKSDLIGAEMYSVNADRVQTDIWKTREEIAALDYIRGFETTTMFYMHAERLKQLLIDEQNANKELERQIECMEKSQYVNGGAMNETSSQHTSRIKADLDKDRFVIRPQIHRRHKTYDLKYKDLPKKDVRMNDINATKPLPAIQKHIEKDNSKAKHECVDDKKESEVIIQTKEKLPPIVNTSIKVDTLKEIRMIDGNVSPPKNQHNAPKGLDIQGNLVFNVKTYEPLPKISCENDLIYERRNVKSEPVMELKAMKYLPAIGQTKNDGFRAQSKRGIVEKNDHCVEVSVKEILPEVEKRLAKDDESGHKDSYRDTYHQMKTESPPSITIQTPIERNSFTPSESDVDSLYNFSTEGRQSIYTDSSELSGVTYLEESEMDIELPPTPTPPSTPKGSGRFNRKNILGKLKSLFGK